MNALDELPREIWDGLHASWAAARIPPHMHEPIAAYIVSGRIPGDFLQAVICNDFAKAVLQADLDNYVNLRAFAGFFYMDAPALCHGNEAVMQAWHARGGLSGKIPSSLEGENDGHL